MRRKRPDSIQTQLLIAGTGESSHWSEDNRRLRAENDRLRTQMASLMAEVDRLQQALTANTAHQVREVRITEPASSPSSPVTKQSGVNEKVSLFRSYFRGREDVYAVRGSEHAGKASYYPKRKYVGKEDGKVIWGDYLLLKDEVIRAHLQDENPPVVVGLYPLLLDETCWFLAIDFDKASWKDDVAAFLDTCREINVPASLERSRSGNGGHVWIFFQEPIPARTARAFGSTLLTRTLQQRHQIGLDSYDRMFPNQDTLPKERKLGNLIALPLQRLAGKEGNSLFIDARFNPYPDQWIYLFSIRKMSLSEVAAIIKEAAQREETIGIGRTLGSESGEESEYWNLASPQATPASLGTWPRKVRVMLSNMLYVHKSGLDSSQIDFIRRLAAFQNPDFYKAQAMRLSTFGKPRIIDCSEETPEYLALPRGCQDELFEVLRNQNTEIITDDRRTVGSKLDVGFHGKLREEQKRSVAELTGYDTGILLATTAFGKTVVAAWMIAARATNTLVLVDRIQLMQQWQERLSVFLDLPVEEIGQVGGGKSKRTGKIDIAVIQGLHDHGRVKDFVKDYGHIIVDECHHMSAISFEQVLKCSTARYTLGLTATLTRKDGKHPIAIMQCGPVRFRVNARSQATQRPFSHVVIPRYTNFKLPDSESAVGIQQLYERLVSDESRNDMIFHDLLVSLEQGRSPILLTDRKSHLDYFENKLKGFARNVIVLRGGMGKKQREAVQEKLKEIAPDEERVILATGRYVGEGFDDERLDTLFLVMPCSWKGTLQQYAGRLHRLYDLKNEVQIYDYVDDQVAVLLRMYQKRFKGYTGMGYTERKL